MLGILIEKEFLFPFYYTVPGRCQSMALTNLAPPLYTGQHKGDTLVCLYFVCVTTVILYFKPTAKFRKGMRKMCWGALWSAVSSCVQAKLSFGDELGCYVVGKILYI